MQSWRGVAAAPAGWGRSVVTIGVFDGVHRGHQETIGHAVHRARQLGHACVVVTFDPHPSEVVRPGTHPAILTESARKAELIETLGVDALCVIPFTVEFSRLSPETFVHDVLVEHLHASAVVVGENFRFGHRAAGDVALLARLGRTFGFTVEGAPLVSSDLGGDGKASPDIFNLSGVPDQSGSVPEDLVNTVLSSTFIRSCVDAGDVAAAAHALGRPHRLEGIVVRGDHRGRELGFPTANLLTSPHAAVPADGVYAAWLIRRGYARRGRGRAGAPTPAGAVSAEPASSDRGRTAQAEAAPDVSGAAPVGGSRLRAAVSIGTNPTFAGRERRVEAFVLDFSGDLYGERVALDFVARLREMRRYDSVAALADQITLDVEATRTLLT